MSFGGGTDYNRGINNLGGSSNLALNSLFPAAFQGGQTNLQQGQNNIGQAGNYFNTLLGGNRANTTAMLQPDINRIQGANQGTLQGVSTLMPRGGGRSGTLFQLPFQQNQQIQSLYGGARSGAAGQLGQLGLGQGGLGANLFGIGTGVLNSANSANSDMVRAALAMKQRSDQLAGGLGGGIFNLFSSLPQLITSYGAIGAGA
jgi:hypothetical protein